MKNRSSAKAMRGRFYILEFQNPLSKSFRVTGYKRDGTCVKKNFANKTEAECECNKLNQEYILGAPPDLAPRATHLTPEQLRIAETAFVKLNGCDAELLIALDYWLEHGKKNVGVESPRLDDAIAKFHTWLETDAPLRDRSKNDLRLRTDMFKAAMPNVYVPACARWRRNGGPGPAPPRVECLVELWREGFAARWTLILPCPGARTTGRRTPRAARVFERPALASLRGTLRGRSSYANPLRKAGRREISLVGAALFDKSPQAGRH
jgi:hypothetical protein